MHRERNLRVVLGIGILIFVLCPLLWIVALSLQQGPPFYLVPRQPSLDSYRQVISEDSGYIYSAIRYSLLLSTSATALAMTTALSAIYLVIAGVSSERQKRRIVQTAIGLYFLPSVAIYPGLEFVANHIIFFRPPVQLFAVYYLQAFAVGFILLFLVYLFSGRSKFDQLLLETGSRLKAFFLGILSPSKVAAAMTAAIAFTTVWSDFFLPALITTASLQPFPVKLQMSIMQYKTEYSVFAAGAVLSLLLSLLSTIVLPALAIIVYRSCLRLASWRVGRMRA